ncbi:MAG TPA: PAS domain S-box protein [Thermomicrobiales bacterium]|nr:PAS domain S-box protein [Thermomicrobiales bacterium]
MTDEDHVPSALSEIDNLPVWLRAVWENTSDAIAVSSEDGTVLLANPSYLALYGYDHDEVVGHSFAVIFPEEQRAWAEEQHRAVFAAPASRGVYEARIRRRDGTERLVEARADFIIEDGTRTAMISTIRDITNRKRVEEALRESEQQLRLIVENAQTYAIFLTDPEDRVTDWFAGAEAVYGWTADEIRGQPAAITFIPEDREAGAPAEETRIAANEGTAPNVRWHQRKDGTRVFIEGVSTALRDEDGVLRGFLKIGQDVTERHRAETEREQARLMAERAVVARDHFLSIGAHELRTPVTSLKGTAQLLSRSIRMGRIEQERLERYSKGLVESSERLELMVNELFDVGRLHLSESGPTAANLERIDLTKLITQAADRYWRARTFHRLTIQANQGPPIMGDPHRIQQVIVNLVENALKYSAASTPVQVTLGFEPGGALITVTDQGIGLPPGSEESIFEPFNRATNAATSTIPGLGLGLYISQKIVEAHGGRLWAESAGVSQGTTMSLWLPVDEPDRPLTTSES